MVSTEIWRGFADVIKNMVSTEIWKGFTDVIIPVLVAIIGVYLAEYFAKKTGL